MNSVLTTNNQLIPQNESSGLKLIGENNLDFCRFFLAILVIFSHSFSLVDGNNLREPIGNLTYGQLNGGNFAVDSFFAISGFLIAHSWIRSRSSISFLKKRILRIYPGYVAATLIGIFIVAPLSSERFELTKNNLLSLPYNLILLRPIPVPGVFPANPYAGSINGALWSIQYEFFCYLGLIIMGSLGLLTRFKRWTIFILFAVIIAAAIYLSGLDRGDFSAIKGASNWCRVLPYFLMGIAFYLYRERIRFLTPGIMSATAALTVASFFPPLGRLVFPFTITYLLYWFAFHPRLKFHDWARHGDFSYGIYLYGWPIQQLIIMHFPGITPLAVFAIATPLSIGAGALSWHLIEKQFLRLK